MKLCNKCKVLKAIKQFTKTGVSKKTGKPLRASWCNKCRSTYFAARITRIPCKYCGNMHNDKLKACRVCVPAVRKIAVDPGKGTVNKKYLTRGDIHYEGYTEIKGGKK